MAAPEETYSEDSGCADGLLALGREPGVDAMSCRECVYPFCVRAEARALTNFARDLTILAMRSMHASAKVIAARVGVEPDIVYGVARRRRRTPNCYWCMVDHKEGGVFCRSSSCTVAYDNGSIAVTLFAHKKATDHEMNVVETLVGNLFPDGVLVSANDSPHDHWVINRVEPDEANFVYGRMTALTQYTAHLR